MLANGVVIHAGLQEVIGNYIEKQERREGANDEDFKLEK